MKKHYQKGDITNNYNLKGKSNQVYSFFGYEFDKILNYERRNEKTIFYIGRTNKSKSKLFEIIYIGIANKVSEIREDKNILNLIHNDFENYSYFIYNEVPFEVEFKLKDIQNNYNFNSYLNNSLN